MPITLIENFRAPFYAPFYAAAALGAYQAEGLDVEIKPSPDAAQTMQTLLAGGGEISWGGPLRLMDAREKHATREPIVFCEVVGRDPFFLVGREPNPRFRLADLLERRLCVTTEVPTPWMCLQHDLRLQGLDPAAVSLGPLRRMAQNAAALRAGKADVIQVFQPFAQELVQSGAGHVWYAAATRGPTAYTTLNTTRRYATSHPETLMAMCRAMYRTQKWIASNDGSALANVVSSYFPDLPQRVLAASYDSYLQLGLWNKTPLQSKEGLSWLNDAALAHGMLKQRFAYDDVVEPRFAQAAMQDDPPSM
ncbi:MAG: ABC transporter substrate-binding protein [Burkholderiales bacterium]